MLYFGTAGRRAGAAERRTLEPAVAVPPASSRRPAGDDRAVAGRRAAPPRRPSRPRRALDRLTVVAVGARRMLGVRHGRRREDDRAPAAARRTADAGRAARAGADGRRRVGARHHAQRRRGEAARQAGRSRDDAPEPDEFQRLRRQPGERHPLRCSISSGAAKWRATSGCSRRRARWRRARTSSSRSSSCCSRIPIGRFGRSPTPRLNRIPVEALQAFLGAVGRLDRAARVLRRSRRLSGGDSGDRGRRAADRHWRRSSTTSDGEPTDGGHRRTRIASPPCRSSPTWASPSG